MASRKTDPDNNDEVDKLFDEIIYSAAEDDYRKEKDARDKLAFKRVALKTVRGWKNKGRFLSEADNTYSVGSLLGAGAAIGLVVIFVFGRTS